MRAGSRAPCTSPLSPLRQGQAERGPSAWERPSGRPLPLFPAWLRLSAPAGPSLPMPRPCRGRGVGSRASPCSGWPGGFWPGCPFGVRPRERGIRGWVVLRRPEPYLFLCSSSRFAAFHSEPWGGRGAEISPSISPLLQCHRPACPPPAAHQVEVGEDAGGTVLLGHE